MKKILYTIFSAGALLLANLFVSNGTFQVTVETPTPAVVNTEVPTTVVEPTATALPTVVLAAPGDPYGELYFTVIAPDTSQQTDPSIPIDKFITRLVRLPGSCVVGLVACPDPEIVPAPFNMQDVLATDYDSGAPIWSPDGRYGMIVIHPQDDLTRGGTTEEWETIQDEQPGRSHHFSLHLYLFDAGTDTWRELYRADRKFFYSARWSPDGQWIAFIETSSMGTLHPSQADDGIYVVHPDGSDLQRLSEQSGNGQILGWVGNSILMCAHFLHPGSTVDFSHVLEKLNFDGQVTTLFESSRLVNYALAPDGGSLLAADGTTRDGGSPQRAVDVLALDGSVIHSFGTFSNSSSPVFPFVWSPDGSQVAFANLRRVYVAPRVSQLDIPADTFGIVT